MLTVLDPVPNLQILHDATNHNRAKSAKDSNSSSLLILSYLSKLVQSRDYSNATDQSKINRPSNPMVFWNTVREDADKQSWSDHTTTNLTPQPSLLQHRSDTNKVQYNVQYRLATNTTHDLRLLQLTTTNTTYFSSRLLDGKGSVFY